MSLASVILSLSPAAWWRMDEASGTTLADSSGNGRTLTLASAPTFRKTSILPNGEGYSMKLATGQPASATDAAWNSITGSWSMLANVRPFDGAFNASFMTKSAETAYGLMLDGDHYPYVYSGGSSIHQNPTPVSMYDGTFKQLVATFNGTTLSIYLNNSLLASAAASNPADTAASFYLGDIYYNNGWDGQDFALWNRALTVGEVASLWAAAGTTDLTHRFHSRTQLQAVQRASRW